MKKHKEADNLVSMKLGARIRELRAARGVSQEWLGDQLGITFQQIQKYEKGTNRVSVPVLFRMATAFGCEVSEILSAVDTSHEVSPVPDKVAEMRLRITKAISILKGKEVDEAVHS